MGSSTGFRRLIAIALALALAATVAVGGVAGASAPRAASPEAKEACQKLKKKIKKKKGKAKAKAKAKYKKCLEEYDEANPPDDGGDTGGGDTGGGTGGGDTGGGTTDPVEAARALIEDHEFYRVSYNSTTGSSFERLWRFCSGGSYFHRSTSDFAGASETYDSGTWSITGAQEGTSEGHSGYVAGVAINGTYDGSPASGSIGVAVSPDTQQSLINVTGQENGWQEFIRRAPTGGC